MEKTKMLTDVPYLRIVNRSRMPAEQNDFFTSSFDRPIFSHVRRLQNQDGRGMTSDPVKNLVPFRIVPMTVRRTSRSSRAIVVSENKQIKISHKYPPRALEFVEVGTLYLMRLCADRPRLIYNIELHLTNVAMKHKYIS